MNFGSSMDANEPKVAVIVASIDARSTIRSSLARFVEEVSGIGELIVVDASRDRTAEVIVEAFPQVRLIRRLPGAVTPELWREGLYETDAPFVAFSTAAMAPNRGWLQQLVGTLEQEDASVVGGPINPQVGLHVIDRAVYLLRYVNYLAPLPTTRSLDPPGDNALYRRECLTGLEAIVAQGFWEAEIHRVLRRRGDALVMAPEASVEFQGGGRLAPTVRQRFIHAMQYGAARGARLHPVERLARTLAAPLVPLVLLRRIVSTLRERDRALGPWIPAVPELALLLLAWSGGEARGLWHRSLSGAWLRAEIAPEGLDEEEEETWEELLWQVGQSDS